MNAAAMLRFIEQDAPTALVGKGNAWLQLVEAAHTASLRCGGPSEQRRYAEATRLALEGLRTYTRMGEISWAELSIRLRVRYLMASDRTIQWKTNEASELAEIFLAAIRAEGVVNGGSPEVTNRLLRLKGSRMAAQLLEIRMHMTDDVIVVLERWIDQFEQ